MNQSTDNNEETVKASNAKIEAIKELIFGENMVEYDQRFVEVQDLIEKSHATIESHLDSLKAELSTSIDNFNTDLNIRISDLEKSIGSRLDKLDASKSDRKSLGKMLENLGKKIQG